MGVGIEDPVAISCHPRNSLYWASGLSAPIILREVATLQRPLFGAAFSIFRYLRSRVGPIPTTLGKGVPGLHAARLEGGHKIPQRRPGHMMRETRIPRDRDAERQMLVEIEIAAKFSFHERKRPRHGGAGGFNFVDRMGRFELYPVDASLFPVSPQPSDRVLQCAVRRIARVAMRHHHEI